MATNITMDKQRVLCKKCGIDHERSVGSKYERVKASKEKPVPKKRLKESRFRTRMRSHQALQV